jgi:hypothetical protein
MMLTCEGVARPCHAKLESACGGCRSSFNGLRKDGTGCGCGVTEGAHREAVDDSLVHGALGIDRIQGAQQEPVEHTPGGADVADERLTGPFEGGPRAALDLLKTNLAQG